MIRLPLLAIVWAATAQATDPSPKAEVGFESVFVREGVTCKKGRHEIALARAGNTKESDPEEEEFGSPHIWMLKPDLVRIPIEASELKFLPSGKKGNCKGALGFVVQGDILALPLAQNDRPLSNKLRVAFIQMKNGAILGVSPELEEGSLRLENDLQGVPDGVVYKAWSPRTDASTRTVTIQGQSVQATEGTFHFWRKIIWRDKKVQTPVDPDRTWKESEFRKYFKKKSDFDRAFGLKADFGGYENFNVVFKAQVGRSTCIQPTSDRAPESDDKLWHCQVGS